MKFSQKLIASAVLLATASFATAADDTATVVINVTKDAYVNFTGNLQSSPTLSVPVASIGPGYVLGTLGLDTNVSGGCDIAVSSTKGFKLVNTADASEDLGAYTITTFGHTFTGPNTVIQNTKALATCDVADQNVVMDGTVVPADQAAGTYNDTLTMTVTMQ